MTVTAIIITIVVNISPTSARDDNMESLFDRVWVIVKRQISCYEISITQTQGAIITSPCAKPPGMVILVEKYIVPDRTCI